MNGTYTTTYTVTIGDINYGGHLGNDKSLLIFQEARIRFLGSLGLSERDIGKATGIVVVEAGCRFHREVFLHDELEIAVTVEAAVGKKFVLQYCVQRKQDGEKVLSGFTVNLAFDYRRRKVVPLPQAFLSQCKRQGYIDAAADCGQP